MALASQSRGWLVALTASGVKTEAISTSATAIPLNGPFVNVMLVLLTPL
jgi:hypothetical protein